METLTVDNEYVKIWIENGIIYNIHKPNIVINLEVARILVRDRLKVANGQAYPLFVDMRSFASTDINARKYLAGEEATQLVIAGALLINNPVAKFAVNLFITINEPKAPARIFTNKTKALKWLQQYVETE